MPQNTNNRMQMRSQRMALQFIVGQLDVQYDVEIVGQKTQVYYDNTGVFEPDRTTTPTTLIPHVTVSDQDTGRTYAATIASVLWEEVTKDGATIIDDNPNSDYEKQQNGKVLVINKNVVPENPVDIRVTTTYDDPRGNGRTYSVTTTVHLVTIKDADIVHPRLNVISENVETFDPYFDEAEPLYTFKAEAFLANANISDELVFSWYAKDDYNANFTAIDAADTMNHTVNGSTTEVQVGKFPSYQQASQVVGGETKGQGTDTIILDARYARHMQIKLKARYRYAPVVDPTGNPQSQGWYEQVENPTTHVISYVATTDTTVVEGKVYYTTDTPFFKDEVVRGLEWVSPNCDFLTMSENGSKILQEHTVLKFSPIINVKCMNPRSLEDADIDKLYAMNWKKTLSNDNLHEYDMGWGKHIEIDSDDFTKNYGVQTNLYYDVYLQENLCAVIDTNPDTNASEPVVENGELVFGTFIDFPQINS